MSIVFFRSDIRCNECAVLVVGTRLYHSLGTWVCAQRWRSWGGISWNPYHILVDVRLCNRLYKPPGGTLVDGLPPASRFRRVGFRDRSGHPHGVLYTMVPVTGPCHGPMLIGCG